MSTEPPRRPDARPTDTSPPAPEPRAYDADRSRDAATPPAGRLEAIWIKRFRGARMDAVDHATVRAGQGIEGNTSHGRRRQVTLLDRDAWDGVTARLGRAVHPSARRANLLISGVSLEASRGRKIAIGGVRILIHGETRPCHLMDEAAAGLRSAMLEPWAGGAFGEVCNDGDIRVGDAVRFVDQESGGT